MTKWTPPLQVTELARTVSHLARGARHVQATWGEPGAALPQREPARLGNLRIRLGASVGFDENLLTWTAIIPGIDGSRDEIVQSPSLTVMCDALDAAVTRRSVHVERAVRDGLAVLAMNWTGIYHVGYDKVNQECRARRIDGHGERLSAPSPELLNKLMADDYIHGSSSPGAMSATG